MITHKEGVFVLFSEGEYSDYGTGPMIRVLKDLDIGALALAFLDQAPPSKWHEGEKDADGSSFAKWLIENGWAEEHVYDEVHTGGGCSFELAEMERAAEERARTIH